MYIRKLVYDFKDRFDGIAEAKNVIEWIWDKQEKKYPDYVPFYIYNATRWALVKKLKEENPDEDKIIYMTNEEIADLDKDYKSVHYRYMMDVNRQEALNSEYRTDLEHCLDLAHIQAQDRQVLMSWFGGEAKGQQRIDETCAAYGKRVSRQFLNSYCNSLLNKIRSNEQVQDYLYTMYNKECKE